jgi:hypothetical protein
MLVRMSTVNVRNMEPIPTAKCAPYFNGGQHAGENVEGVVRCGVLDLWKHSCRIYATVCE